MQKGIARAIDQIGPDSAVLVAEDGAGACVGFVTIQRETRWTGEEQAYVPELVVAEAAEGKGVGRALVAEVEAWAREQGLHMIELDTGIRNSHSRAFYARLGFAEESVKLVKVLGDVCD
jgi:GNAT superfamily N-acetyltransferase